MPPTNNKPAVPMPPPAALPPAGVLAGASKAAAWLMSSDEETAVAALALLDNTEIQRLRKAIEQLPKLAPDQLATVHQEFRQVSENAPLRLHGNVDYLGHLAVQAFGEVKAQKLLHARKGKAPATALLEADPTILASLLTGEHPQVTAAVISTLPATRASDLLSKMPPPLARDIIVRLARLTKVSQVALARAEQVISAGLPVEETQDINVDGVRLAATVLNGLAPEESEKMLRDLEREQAQVAAEVRLAMFTFEDLARLDKRNMQTLLKDVPNDKLLLALKAATDEVKGKILGAMSKRASEMMIEELSLLGPTRLSEVEAAQTEIAQIAIKLREAGKLTIAGTGGGDFV